MLPANTILGPSGVPVWSGDEAGNTVQVGTATVLDLVLTAEPAPVPPAPGYLRLYSPDGEALALLDPANVSEPVSLGKSYATVVFPSNTVTGVSAATLLATGITVPAGALATGQIYHVVAWGTLNTTVDTQTVKWQLNWGGVAGTDLMDFGAQNPNSGATVTGGAWRCEWDVQITAPTTAATGGFNGPNFSPQTINRNIATGLSTAANPFTVVVTPSAAGVSVTIDGGYCERRN